MVETLSEKQTYQLIFHNLFPLWIFSVPKKLISEKKNYICLISVISPLKIQTSTITKYQINTKKK